MARSIKIIILMAFLWVSAPMMVFAQIAPIAPMPPQFMPVGGWNVEKTAFAQTQGLAGVKLPCMMATNYDNGFIVRFSGHSGQMLAMAIDFRQDVFTQGRKYPANVGVNGGAGFGVTATAFSESTLIFNLRPVAGFYQQLGGASVLTLNVDGNVFNFGLGGAPEALGRLESCFGPSTRPVGALPVGVNEPPKLNAKDMNKSFTPSAPSTSAPRVPRAPASMMNWQASAGDDIRSTLERWSAQAGVALQWQSDRVGQVVSDIQVSGSFADAVQLLMAQNSTALGIDANMRGTSMAAPVSPMMPPQPISPISVPPRPQAVAQWNAPAGANLQLVLQKWSEDEGVSVIWQSHHNFVLKAPVNTAKSYEAALQAMLSQFSNDNIRPAAQLNNDPQTGKRILIVKSTRVL